MNKYEAAQAILDGGDEQKYLEIMSAKIRDNPTRFMKDVWWSDLKRNGYRLKADRDSYNIADNPVAGDFMKEEII